MKIKLDENMPGDARDWLASQGCDVETVVSENLGGEPDPIIVTAANAEGRVLFTFDKGIANTTDPAYQTHAGIVLLRLKHPSTSAILQLLKTYFGGLAGKDLTGRIVVISSSGVRMR